MERSNKQKTHQKFLEDFVIYAKRYTKNILTVFVELILILLQGKKRNEFWTTQLFFFRTSQLVWESQNFAETKSKSIQWIFDFKMKISVKNKRSFFIIIITINAIFIKWRWLAVFDLASWLTSWFSIMIKHTMMLWNKNNYILSAIDTTYY